MTAYLDAEATIKLLSKILRDIPRMSDAACIGRPELFDITESVEAEAGLEICRRCCCLESCRSWADAQPRSALNGVVGGTIRPPRSTHEGKRKKPKKPRPRPRPRPQAVPA